MTAVYVMSVEGQKLCKIGWSKWPKSRLHDMRTCYTTPRNAKMKLEYMRDCGVACRLVEQKALELLSEFRTAPKREWIEVTPEEAIKAVRRAARQLGVKLRDTPEIHRVRGDHINKEARCPSYPPTSKPSDPTTAPTDTP